MNKFGFSSNDQWAPRRGRPVALQCSDGFKERNIKEKKHRRPRACIQCARPTRRSSAKVHTRSVTSIYLQPRPTRICPFSLSFRGAGHYIIHHIYIYIVSCVYLHAHMYNTRVHKTYYVSILQYSYTRIIREMTRRSVVGIYYIISCVRTRKINRKK